MMLPESVTFMPPIRVLLWALALLASCAILGPGARAQDTASADAAAENFFGKHASSESGHTNNWAVLVCASRYWFNYRVRQARSSGRYAC
jgi:phosphatidylinositol glycan class K